ncbi:unnamed protein product, partial [Ectocarpus sp. 12 AP-2014]
MRAPKDRKCIHTTRKSNFGRTCTRHGSNRLALCAQVNFSYKHVEKNGEFLQTSTCYSTRGCSYEYNDGVFHSSKGRGSLNYAHKVLSPPPNHRACPSSPCEAAGKALARPAPTVSITTKTTTLTMNRCPPLLPRPSRS